LKITYFIIIHYISLMSAFTKAMNSFTSRTDGENGAPCHSTTSDPLLDLFFNLVRDLPDAELKTLLSKVLLSWDANDFVHAFIMCFQTRDCRGGKGERDLAYKFFVQLYDHQPKAALAVVHLFPEYGYYKDFLNLLELTAGVPARAPLQRKIIEVFSAQLKQDHDNLTTPNYKFTLAGKFMPGEGKEFATAHPAIFKKLTDALFPGVSRKNGVQQRLYRTMKSTLNQKLDTTEVKMCSGHYADIEFSKVASLTVNKWKKAFLNEKLKQRPNYDEEETGNRYPDSEDRVAARQHLRAAATSTDPKKQLKGGQLAPHEITRQFMHRQVSTGEKETAIAQWNDLRSKVVANGTHRPTVSVVDVSGSMAGTPIEVAVALGILLSELTHPAFRDHLITFHNKPEWVKLTGDLESKVQQTLRANLGMNTNLELVFDLILEVVKAHKLKQEDIPDLAIFSDMQFDAAVSGGYQTHLERVKTKFQAIGLKAPRIVFWNLRAATGFPAEADSDNVVMLSGYSQSLFKYVLEDTPVPAEPTPLETMLRVLDDERYAQIRTIVTPLL
jgi:hypothetical protein